MTTVQGETLTTPSRHEDLAFPAENLELTVGELNEHRGALDGGRSQTSLDGEGMTGLGAWIDPADDRPLQQFDTRRTKTQLRITSHPELTTGAKHHLHASWLCGAQ
ncbi:MAG: Uncharacterised protein [Prochlorococcus marinus str. MIT 9215]|nr:MAG: Uncharacterised protein [Prochlorococcus marinus str. MIT 9215]